MKNTGNSIKTFLNYPGVRVIIVIVAIIIIVISLIKAGWMPYTLGLSIMGGIRGIAEPSAGPYSLPVSLTAIGVTPGGYQVAGENGFNAQGMAQEGFTDDASENSVNLYYSKSCPHCQAWKDSEFPAFMRMMKTEMPNVKVAMYDSGDEIEKKHFPSDISGVPTIRITSGGKLSEYNGERNADALMAFVKQQ